MFDQRGFWGLWCRPVAGAVVVGRNDYGEVEVVVDEGFGYAVAMAVVGVVVGAGFGYAVELRAVALAGGEYPRCIAFLRASLAPY
jgi:hypothetical protein